MKNLKWLRMAFLLAGLAIVLVACGAGTATTAVQPEATQATGGQTPLVVQSAPTAVPTKTPLAPPTVVPTPALPESLDSSKLVALNSFDSYRSTTTISSSGTQAGKQVQETTTIKEEYIKNPFAHHMLVTTTGTAEATGPTTFELYTVEGTEYLNMGGTWTSAPAAAAGAGLNLISGDKVLQKTCGWTKSGTVDVAGIQTADYKLSAGAVATCPDIQTLFGQGTITQASGDVYIAVDGNYVVKIDITFQGTNLQVMGSTSTSTTLDQGTEQMQYALSDVNKSFTIEVPAEAKQAAALPSGLPVPTPGGQTGALPSDIPAPSDAQLTANVGGVVILSSASTAQQVSDFYKAEMPKNGWTAGTESQMPYGYSLTFTKGGRTATIVITGAAGSKTTLEINVQGQ
jgi:hypothetical protein